MNELTLDDMAVIDESEEMKYIRSLTRVQLEMVTFQLLNQLYQAEEILNGQRKQINQANAMSMANSRSVGGVVLAR